MCVRGCNNELLQNVLRTILLSTTGKANVFTFDGNERISLNTILLVSIGLMLTDVFQCMVADRYSVSDS